MTTPGTVNDMITDSVATTSTLLTGSAPPQGMAMLDVVSAETIGMAMHNAITAQQNAQLTANASITTTCARMLSMEPVPPPPSPTTNPPPFMPLSTETASDPNSMLKVAGTLAENAIAALKKQDSSDQATQKALDDLINKLKGLDPDASGGSGAGGGGTADGGSGDSGSGSQADSGNTGGTGNN